MAVKKTRASRALTNTQLNHERLILQRLQGHASIPIVFAYGRAEQFEYLAMELLGDSLSDITKRCGPLPHLNISVIAEQMVRDLEAYFARVLFHPCICGRYPLYNISISIILFMATSSLAIYSLTRHAPTV